MSERTLQVNISKDRLPTSSDKLPTDILTIEPLTPINLNPGVPTQINLAIYNSSSVGRMARVSVNYDASHGLIVQIPEQHIYVHPQSKTVISALVEARLTHQGTANISFRVQ